MGVLGGGGLGVQGVEFGGPLGVLGGIGGFRGYLGVLRVEFEVLGGAWDSVGGSGVIWGSLGVEFGGPGGSLGVLGVEYEGPGGGLGRDWGSWGWNLGVLEGGWVGGPGARIWGS